MAQAALSLRGEQRQRSGGKASGVASLSIIKIIR